ncbi:large subunit GTPase 1 homolog [Octopus sinensis]|uniref:Large subunit GTPase 1 homolog n=1 Tax=Octopus sinensis TaxID=2607531 RepID=A0A6P7TIX1_9MOLL|nr:large subunit GTPase 1 homolog [Octopus sinensis]
MGKNDKGQVLGRSIIKERFAKKKHGGQKCFVHTSELNDGYEWGRLNLASVTEQSNLEDFLATAELAGTEFTAEKLNVKFIDRPNDSGLPSADELKLVKAVQDKNKELLRIPRRPDWDSNTTPEELAAKERELFLLWRKSLSLLQAEDHVTLTPYEKNLDFWRQLWRVLERSDVIVQIVDARNPLLFRCQDVEKYVHEIDSTKVNVILINKADFLTEKQRQYWAKYFSAEGVRVAFWSAIEETKKHQQMSKTQEQERSDIPEELKKLAESVQENAAVEEDAVASPNNSTVKDDEKDGNDADNHVGDSVKDLGSSSAAEPDQAVVPESTTTDIKSVELAPESHSSCHEMQSKTKSGVEEMMSTLCLSPPDSQEGSSVEKDSVNTDCEGKENEDDKDGDDEDEEDSHQVITDAQDTKTTAPSQTCAIENSAEVLDTHKLLEFLKSLHVGPTYQPGVTTLGMVGFPNVGKSSTINAILQTKKVPVSATPGRTKHFQTLFVDKSVMLCDCPGLVFPSFVSTKADLIINGILPIDQLRDHVPPVSLVCQQIPRTILEDIYGIMIPKPDEYDDPDRPPTALELLNAYGYMRGFMTPSSVPDCPRSSRYILKDYVNGKLLYCHPPPGVLAEDFSDALETYSKKVKKETSENSQLRHSRQKMLDSSFFSNNSASYVYSKGKRGVKGYARLDGLKQVGLSDGDPNKKPGKKHYNKNKKEKLRRVYHHLDEH